MQSFWTPLRVGLVVALGVAAFGFGLYLIGAEKFGTDRTYLVYAVFDDATGNPLSRPNLTAAITSETPAQRTITAGCLSNEPFQILRCRS